MRGRRGRPAYLIVKAHQGRRTRMSTIFAVSNERDLVHRALKEGGYNSINFREFLEEYLANLSNTPVISIFENVQSHNSASVASLQLSHASMFSPSSTFVKEHSAFGFKLVMSKFPKYDVDVFNNHNEMCCLDDANGRTSHFVAIPESGQVKKCALKQNSIFFSNRRDH